MIKMKTNLLIDRSSLKKVFNSLYFQKFGEAWPFLSSDTCVCENSTSIFIVSTEKVSCTRVVFLTSGGGLGSILDKQSKGILWQYRLRHTVSLTLSITFNPIFLTSYLKLQILKIGC